MELPVDASPLTMANTSGVGESLVANQSTLAATLIAEKVLTKRFVLKKLFVYGKPSLILKYFFYQMSCVLR